MIVDVVAAPIPCAEVEHNNNEKGGENTASTSTTTSGDLRGNEKRIPERGTLRSTDGATKGKGKGKASGSRTATRPAKLPGWMPVECDGWAAAFDLCGLEDEEEFEKTYHLPPPNLFVTLGDESPDGVITRFHNWLRIRPWCQDLVVNTPAHGMVLLRPAEWRIALFGRYYQIDHAVAEDEDPEVAETRRKAMALLRPHPDAAKHEEKRSMQGPPAKKPRLEGSRPSYKERKQQDMLAMRATISVRFGVHGKFAPYNSEMTVWWQGDIISRKDVESRKDIWATVVWELSLLSFRLELLQLDRHYCPSLYLGQDGGFVRSQAVAGIWGHDGMVLPDLSTAEVDFLSSRSAAVRHDALRRFADVLSKWPGGEAVSALAVHWEKDAESRLFAFYIRAGHKFLSRLPLAPRVRP